MFPRESPGCPECASELTYELGDLQVCSMCAHEWTAGEAEAAGDGAEGDPVTIVWNLKVKGIPSDMRVDGLGPMMLRSSVVKEA